MSDPVVTTAETELRPLVERALASAYELDREIGRGGMGIVYRAKDRRLKRAVAIKLLPPELAFRSEIRTRFLREAETAAQLNHPHIVPIYSVDESEGLVYFVMACVDGDNLGKRIHERGPLPIDETRRILSEVADALAYAHDKGVVHRDIKPDNILLDADGRAMVTDFGIARAIIEGADSRLTATGMAIGTPAYMSPEQAAGDKVIDGRSDLYSLGIVAYQMLAGVLPFDASSTPALLVKHLSEKPISVEQRRPDVPPDLSAIVMRLLAKEPEHRVHSAAELEGMLQGTVTPPAASYNTTRPATAQAPSAIGQQQASYGSPNYATQPGFTGGYASFNQPPAYGNYPAPIGAADVQAAVADAFEQERWRDPRVAAFRRKLGWFAIMGSVLFVVSIFGNSDFFTLLGLWAIYLAYKYAKLWSDGFDWHDVLRQPKERLFVDVMAEQADSVSAIFDKQKRHSVRERARQQRLNDRSRPAALPAGSGQAPSFPAPIRPDAAAFGPFAEQVRSALLDREEIERLLGTFPSSERSQLAEVGPTANRLAATVQSLANTVAELDRSSTGDALQQLEDEIGKLEAQANPLDRLASEDRVKKLAYLKRQRRGLKEIARRRAEAASRLEDARITLQNMRLDLVRLRTGAGGTYVQMTTLMDRANQLARDVDGALQAAAEIRRI